MNVARSTQSVTKGSTFCQMPPHQTNTQHNLGSRVAVYHTLQNKKGSSELPPISFPPFVPPTPSLPCFTQYCMHGDDTAPATLRIVALFTEKTGLLRVTAFAKESSPRKEFQRVLLRVEQWGRGLFELSRETDS